MDYVANEPTYRLMVRDCRRPWTRSGVTVCVFVELHWTKLSLPQSKTFSKEVSISDTSLFRILMNFQHIIDMKED